MTKLGAPDREIAVYIPQRTDILKTKKIAGPYHRLKNQYLLMIALIVAGKSYRWEPHIIVDRLGYLGEEGVSVVAGPLSLIKYSGRRSLQEIARRHGITNIYLPPWGFPLIFAFETVKPGEEELILLDMAGLANAKNLVKQLVDIVEVVEV